MTIRFGVLETWSYENVLGLASSLGSCELVTDSSDGFAVNAWRHGIEAVRHLRCLIALPYAFHLT
jgi:hypothetical protein